MIDNQWAFDLETNVFSTIKKKALAILEDNYPDISITADEESNDTPVFPTVLIQAVEPTETNSDLEADRINTVDFTAQVTVTTNRSRSEALQVSNVIADLYKKRLFKIKPMPFVRKGNLWTATFRAKRKFGWNDIL